jgi:hypothetical protein
MTAQGSARARFARAVATGNVTLVLAAAAEVGRLDLADTLAITLVLAGVEGDRFDRALVRWHARWCLEMRPGPDESQLALTALRALRGPARETAVGTLCELLDARGPRAASRVLADWAERAAA